MRGKSATACIVDEALGGRRHSEGCGCVSCFDSGAEARRHGSGFYQVRGYAGTKLP